MLPVRARTVAAARLAAAAIIGTLFAVAINLPTAIVYTAVSSVHPAFAGMAAGLFGHLLATVLGCLFVFFTLIAVRGLIACMRTRIAESLATAGQLVTMVLLVEVFLFLPAVLPPVVKAMLAGDRSYAAWPPVWFAALYSSIWGSSATVLIVEARLALVAVPASIVAAVAVYLASASSVGRRVLEARERRRASRLVALAQHAAAVTSRTAVVRSIFVFALASLTRSRRHTLVLATYFGLAVATATLGLLARGLAQGISVAQPATHLLALPLVFTFFAVFGLRASFAIPTDADANWLFRLSQPSVTACATACAVTILVCGVAPIVAVTGLVAFIVWEPATAVAVTLFDVVSALALTECALSGWTKVPFACAHAAATETLKWRWPLYLLLLYWYAFGLAHLQGLALRSSAGTGAYLLIGCVVIAAMRALQHRRRQHETLTFDVVSEQSFETLDLSGALH